MHAYYEMGLWRWWFGRAHVEFAFPSHWIGFMVQGDSDSESGCSVSISVGLFAIYFVSGQATSRCGEFAYGIRLDANYIRVSRYHGDDEMNHMPWMWEWPWRRWVHVRCDVIGKTEEHQYAWHAPGGPTGVTTATVTPQEREWRWMHKRSPVKRVRRYIDVKFADEVGPEIGSWKGGTIGCGYSLRRDETPHECLRRMERERRF